MQENQYLHFCSFFQNLNHKTQFHTTIKTAVVATSAKLS